MAESSLVCVFRDMVLGNTDVDIIPIAAVTVYVCRVFGAKCVKQVASSWRYVCRASNCHSLVVDLWSTEISRGLAADFMHGGVSVDCVRPALRNCVASSLVTTWRIILFSRLFFVLTMLLPTLHCSVAWG